MEVHIILINYEREYSEVYEVHLNKEQAEASVSLLNANNSSNNYDYTLDSHTIIE